MNNLTIIFFILCCFYIGLFFGILLSYAVRKMKENELDSFKDECRYNNHIENISDN